jgi:oligoribonuclease NrnB/cAMP/cGMP phosphodiesterase (DHH superfamily)
MWRPDVCVFHGGCDDGFGAAWAVWKLWGDDIEYVGMRYGDKLPDIAGKHVLMVDFSLKRDAMIEAAKAVQSIIVLDHHKTAEAELAQWNIGPVQPFHLDRAEDNIAQAVMEQAYPVLAHFDMEKSGAWLTWAFCHPNAPIPRLLEHIQDRDLWRFALPYTKMVSAAIRSRKHEFALFDQWSTADGLRDLIYQGGVIERAHSKNVGEFLANAYVAKINGHKVPVVNVPYHYASDCAHELLQRNKDAPFAAAWFRRGDGSVQWSLRSEDARIDVSEIAKKFGGGGHRNAAGFQVPA